MNIPSRFMPSTFFPFINIITNGTVSLALAALESTEDSSKLFIHLQFSPTRVKLFYLKASTCCNTLNWLWAIKVSISFIQLRREPVWNYFSFPSFFRTTSKLEFCFEVKIFTIRFPHFSFFPRSEPGRQRANIFPSSEKYENSSRRKCFCFSSNFHLRPKHIFMCLLHFSLSVSSPPDDVIEGKVSAASTRRFVGLQRVKALRYFLCVHEHLDDTPESFFTLKTPFD